MCRYGGQTIQTYRTGGGEKGIDQRQVSVADTRPMAFSVNPPGSLLLWVWVDNSEEMRSADIWGEHA